MEASTYSKLSAAGFSSQADAGAGRIRYWGDGIPRPGKRATGQRGPIRRREPFDAVLEVALGEAVRRGLPRHMAHMAVPGVQLVLGHAIDREDGTAAIAIGRESGLFAVAAGSGATVARCNFLFGPFGAVAMLDVGAAVGVVRGRAKEHGIALPKRLALSGLPKWAEQGLPDAPQPAAPGGLLLRWRKPPEPALSIIAMIGGFAMRPADMATAARLAAAEGLQ